MQGTLKLIGLQQITYTCTTSIRVERNVYVKHLVKWCYLLLFLLNKHISSNVAKKIVLSLFKELTGNPAVYIYN